MLNAKVFIKGRGQVIRLPKEFHFKAKKSKSFAVETKLYCVKKQLLQNDCLMY